MPNLKDLKTRIGSVKSTQKITSAMKMVAAAKLRRAQEVAEAARPYAARMDRMLSSLAKTIAGHEGAPAMLAGTGKNDAHLLVVCTANRGLCGGFNSNIIRQTRIRTRALQEAGKTVKLLFIGSKGHDVLKRESSDNTAHVYDNIGKRSLKYEECDTIGAHLIDMFDAGEFDVCSLIFNRFQSAMTQIVTEQQIIPFASEEPEAANDDHKDHKKGDAQAVYIFEPDEDEIIKELLPRNISIQVFQALLENAASEHGARMTAMDSATRNAGDMINALTLTYNRTRQAYITKELIEIISGAEAL